VFAKNKRKH